MKILFVKESQNFPRSSGHDVHGFHMMQELARLGHSIGLLTSSQTSIEAVEGINLVLNTRFSALPKPRIDLPLKGLQGRFVSYWGIDPERPQQIVELVEDQNFDVVVVVGLHVLPYLAGLRNTLRVWYAADEWLWHHWSQFRLLNRSTWHEAKDGAIKGLYERAFNCSTDRVWAVSSKDKSALRWVMGAKEVDVLPNGVDTEQYRPIAVDKTPKSCVFWGRLDFGPNLDAIRWFGENVWTELRHKHPTAIWRVFGFCAHESIHKLQKQFGFDLTADLPDLRLEVQRCQVVVLPFVSGGGIKNKLLEAAAMGMPIIASNTALNGISLSGCPINVASTANDWLSKLNEIWANFDHGMSSGERNRDWVARNYTWHQAAKRAESGLLETLNNSTTL